MSSTVDTNVLLYASDESSPFHEHARELLDQLARGPDLLYLFWPVLMGYLRISTHPAIFPNPLTPREAQENVDELIGLPHVRTSGEEEGFWRTYRATTSGMVVRGNLVPDAHLVTLMRQNGVATIWTHDRDYRTFERLTVRDPFD